MLMSTPLGLTIHEIAEQQGLSVHTVKLHRGKNQEMWQGWEVGERRVPGRRGRPEKEYDAAEVARFYDEREQASPQGKRGPKRRSGVYDPEEIVGWETIAERLGINEDTARGYPSRYARGSNPFPQHIRRGRYRWGDIVAWDDRRGKSGRPGPRTIPGGVAAHRARQHIIQLKVSGLNLADIARESGVPARTVHRVAAGELTVIKPEHRDALLALRSRLGR
ncbi:hypothetical protein ACFY4C_41285 [Actinomadura viridis]|uniref:hypothetical protein n=1 Tax=Actinomadura viridis TaxID=58110 RepID=UPI00367CE2A7